MKQYIGISRDHSRSMFPIARPAARDYNDSIAAIHEAASANQLDTIVSVVKCGVGVGATVEREIVNSNVQVLRPIDEADYRADGSATPLWDSVGELIDLLRRVPDAADPEVSFLVMVITDGEENHSQHWNAARLGQEIQRLQASDRWTFVFRVPRGHTERLVRFGIPEGNILEWEQTARGIAAAGAATRSAMASYYTNRRHGITSTGKFYADLSKISAGAVRQTLRDISGQVSRYAVSPPAHGVSIKTFIEAYVPYRIGTVFYQLTKTEKIQEHKSICLCDRSTDAIYGGAAARDLLGLPSHGLITLTPHRLGNYDVFVQSTSVNRKLVGGTTVLYWPDA